VRDRLTKKKGRECRFIAKGLESSKARTILITPKTEIICQILQPRN
jgi:hypothetical protein